MMSAIADVEIGCGGPRSEMLRNAADGGARCRVNDPPFGVYPLTLIGDLLVRPINLGLSVALGRAHGCADDADDTHPWSRS